MERGLAARAGVSSDIAVIVVGACFEHGRDVSSKITRAERVLAAVPVRMIGEVEARLITLACDRRVRRK